MPCDRYLLPRLTAILPLKMQRTILCLLLALDMCGPGCHACNLTQTLYDESLGLLHRCLNTTGTNEWHLNVACWVRPLDDVGGDILELQVGDKYRLPDGRNAAECRNRYSTVALVYHVCLDRNDSSVRWPGDVWTGSDGLRYTCTNASLATSSLYFGQSSRVVLFGCNSTASGQIVAPGSSEPLNQDGIVRKCAFSGTERRDIQYSMEAVGCWLPNRSNTKEIMRLSFGEVYSLPAVNGSTKSILATCKQRYYNKQALVYNMCRENGTSGEALRQPGSAWTGSDGTQLECLPANPSELASAQIIVRGCYANSTPALFTPGSESRRSDGSIARCIFSRYKSAYGWFETVGCWLKAPFWSKVTNLSHDLQAGKEFCPGGKLCLARCEKRRYREEVALLAKVCFENVGKGAIYRQPHENWTDDTGTSRTCVPMADQSSKFGVGAETILSGCNGKVDNGTVPPGTLLYGDDFIVYECAFNSYDRRYSFKQVAGCWMHDSSGRRVKIAAGEALKLPGGQAVATCRKRSSSMRVTFTVQVCFKDKQSFPLKWSNSSIALPGDFQTNGSSILQCNPAATNTDGVHARWILYGCPSPSGVEAPGARQLSDDGIIRECAHNKREDMSAAYSWVNPIGCWFRDHLNETIVISRFNTVFNHSAIGRPTAYCEHRRYSDPKLRMHACLSAPNRRFYFEGDKWADQATGLTKQCVRASRYSSDGVVAIDAGCLLQAPKVSSGDRSSTEPQHQLMADNGTVAYGSENRILRCDFSEYSRKYEWLTSVACWYTSSGTPTVLLIGQEVWSGGMLISKCQSRRNGATFVRYACEHNGTWHGAMSSWRDSSYRYKCTPASGDRHAEAKKTHCLTDDGTAIEESKTIKGVEYVCMRICGFLVFVREPKPQHFQLLFSLINNCHAVNMNIVNNIG